MKERAADPLLLQSYGRRLLKSRWFLPSLQGIGLFLLIAGIFLGFFGVQETKKSWTRWIFWKLWWQGGLVLILFTMGKAWCGICPLRAINRMAERLSLGFSFPKSLRNIVLSIVLYIVAVRLIMVLPGVALGKSPYNTAAYFLAFIILAAAIGVLFKRGTFCRYVCPISSATDVYALAAPVELRPDRNICIKCRTRDCVKGNICAPGCRYGLFPGNLSSDRHCTFCLDCLKSCPNDAMHFKIRPLFSRIWNEVKPNAGESFLSVTVFTLIFFRMGVKHHPFWANMTAWLGAPPETPYFALIRYVVTFFFCLVGVTILYTGACRLSAWITGEEMRRHFSIFGYGYLPFIIIVGLLRYGWFDLGGAKLILPYLIGTAVSIYGIIMIGHHRLRSSKRGLATGCHILLFLSLSIIILIFQNFWPMRLG